MPLIFEDTLIALLPRNKDTQEWCELLNEMMPMYEINTEERIAGFIAQCSHESAQFTVLEENLNYSADALGKIFGKYFKDRDAEDYHRQPEKIANVIYANRMGNGDTESGEGYKFRGRGVIQLTGKDNYSRFASACGKDLDEVIEYLSTKRGALHSALWYWDSRKLNEVADRKDIKEMTKKINGGYIGLEDREHHFEKALRLMSGEYDHFTFTKTFGLGDKGEHVEQLQIALGVDADGHFGHGTMEALIEFQVENDLMPDGMVGPATAEAINKSLKS